MILSTSLDSGLLALCLLPFPKNKGRVSPSAASAYHLRTTCGVWSQHYTRTSPQTYRIRISRVGCRKLHCSHAPQLII